MASVSGQKKAARLSLAAVHKNLPDGKAEPYRTVLRQSRECYSLPHGPKRCRYSTEVMKALTISALAKLPLNWFSLLSQKS
ncbi:MAG: hypothetical protein QOK48_2089 [Blastocatellia bacterium]|nr:hypothetical protein [Blastocatellia bacterium]